MASSSTSTKLSDGAECLTLDFSPRRQLVNRWQRLPDCDEFVGARRSKHTMVAFNESIYIFGGDNGKQMLNDLIRFDTNDCSWGRAFTTGQLPAPRYHHSAVVYESSMFVCGGYTGDIHSNMNLANKNDLFEYKFCTGQWAEVKSEGKLPPARSAHGAVMHNGQMWLFGGFDGHTRLNDMWRIDLSLPLRRWEEIDQNGEQPPPCCNFAMSIVDDSIYLFSGESGAKSANSLSAFSIKTRTWSRITKEHILRSAPSPPQRRYGHTMVAHGQHLYVFGGATAESIYSSDLHAYDLETHAWRNVRVQVDDRTGIPACRLFHSAVVIGESIYIFGGTIDNNVRRSSEIYRFQLASYPRCTLHEDFGRLLQSGQFCDLKFLVGAERVPIVAHVAIVAARSLFLRNRIKQAREQLLPDAVAGQASSSAACLEVAIEDAQPLPFEMILEYIYTDKIDPTQRIHVEPCSNAVVVLMMDVCRLALRFRMKRLEVLCVQFLESAIEVKNVLAALQAASRIELDFIRDFCLKFCVKEPNYSQIVLSKDFETIEQPLMVEIVRRRLAVSSLVLRQPADTSFRLADDVGSTLVDDMRNFLEGIGEEFADLTLTCRIVSTRVHKVILAARSGYFEAMFRSFMPEGEACVKIALGDIVPSESAFRTFLKFIYYGCTEMPPEDSLYLFSAPYFYSFTNNRLQAFCKENLETNIRSENVLEILEAADRINACELKTHALKLVVKNFTHVSQLSKLQQLSRELLLGIIQAVAEGVNSGFGSASTPRAGEAASPRSASDDDVGGQQL